MPTESGEAKLVKTAVGGSWVGNSLLCLWVSSSLVIFLLAGLWLLVDVLGRGGAEWDVRFLITPVQDAGRSGGIGPVIVSTILVLCVAIFSSVPLALLTALGLTFPGQPPGLWSRIASRIIDLLAGVPSIVFGLFGNALFCIYLNWGYSILSGGLTLACMILPILVRTTQQAIRSVPVEYAHGAVALGVSWSTILWRIVLPRAWSGLVTGWVLGLGRALAETAALIFTAGYVTRMPESLGDSGRTLSVHIYDLAMNVPGGESRAYATAGVLLVLLLLGNLLASILSGANLKKGVRLG